MTTRRAAAVAREATIIGQGSSRDRLTGYVFLGFLLLSLTIGLVTLGVLLVDVLIDGVPVARQAAPAERPVGRSREGRRPARDPCVALPRHPADRLLGTAGRRGGRLPRGVRSKRALVQPNARGGDPEPRRRALDRLRHPRSRVHRPRPRPRANVDRRSDHPDTRGPPDGDRRLSRGDPGCARLDPPGRLRARGDEVAGRPPPGPPGCYSRGSPRDRSSASLAASARLPRCCSSAR